MFWQVFWVGRWNEFGIRQEGTRRASKSTMKENRKTNNPPHKIIYNLSRREVDDILRAWVTEHKASGSVRHILVRRLDRDGAEIIQLGGDSRAGGNDEIEQVEQVEAVDYVVELPAATVTFGTDPDKQTTITFESVAIKNPENLSPEFNWYDAARADNSSNK